MPVGRVSVIGSGRCASDKEGQLLYDTSVELGKLLAESGFTIVCGGLGGVMDGVCKGAAQGGGDTIGILPSLERETANRWVKIPVATGLGQMRNMLVVANGDIVVAVGGGYGTLSEVALAKKSGKKVIAIGNMATVDGVISAKSPNEACELIIEFFER